MKVATICQFLPSEIILDDAKETDLENVVEDSVDRKSRRDNFLRSMEEKIDPTNPEHKERFIVIKNQIIEKVKATQYRRARSRSVNSSGRSPSQKRDLSSDSKSQELGKSPVRPRTSGIPKVK